MSMISQRLRDSARGQPCMFRIPMCCNGDPSTTVLAHAPSESKGMGNKSHDFLAAFACSACHDAIDNNRKSLIGLRHYYWLDALKRQWVWWVEHGYIVIPGDAEKVAKRAKPLSKMIPHDGRMRR